MSGGMQMGGMGGMAGMAGGDPQGQLAQLMQNVPDDKLMALAQNVNPDAVQAMMAQDPNSVLPPHDQGMNDILMGKQEITPSPHPQQRPLSLSPQALASLGRFGQDQGGQAAMPHAQAVAPASGRQVNLQPSAYYGPRPDPNRRLTLADLLGSRGR